MSGDRYVIRAQNDLHFVTFTVIDWMDVFTRTDHKLVITDALNYCIKHKGLEVFAWCLMTNHLHLIIRAKDGLLLSDLIRDFKRHTAKKTIELIETGNESRKEWLLNRMQYRGSYLKRIEKYKFWEDSNHAVFLDPHKPEMIAQRLYYIHQNPVRALIVDEAESYIFSSARDYAGEKGMVDVILLL